MLQHLVLWKHEKLRTQNVIREGLGLKLLFFLKCQEQFRAMNALGHEVILVPVMKRICQTKTCQFTLKERKEDLLTGTTSSSSDQ